MKKTSVRLSKNEKSRCCKTLRRVWACSLRNNTVRLISSCFLCICESSMQLRVGGIAKMPETLKFRIAIVPVCSCRGITNHREVRDWKSRILNCWKLYRELIGVPAYKVLTSKPIQTYIVNPNQRKQQLLLQKRTQTRQQ
jgi:hypothetical protein